MVAAIPQTHSTHVPDKNLEGRKLEIIFSCLFDQISFLDYASFCFWDPYFNANQGLAKASVSEVSSQQVWRCKSGVKQSTSPQNQCGYYKWSDTCRHVNTNCSKRLQCLGITCALRHPRVCRYFFLTSFVSFLFFWYFWLGKIISFNPITALCRQ